MVKKCKICAGNSEPKLMKNHPCMSNTRLKCLIFIGVVKMVLRKIKRMELIVSQCLS